MQLVMFNIFNLIENFLDIINNKYCLIMCAKYYNSSMNDACTICLADIVGLPAKVLWSTAFTTISNLDMIHSLILFSWLTYTLFINKTFEIITTIVYHNN